MCQRLSDDFQRAGADCDCIHGDIRQSQREKTMQKYRDGKLAILIATDVASRGIDVDDVDCVVNFDVPDNSIVIGNPGKIIPRHESPTSKYIVYSIDDME